MSFIYGLLIRSKSFLSRLILQICSLQSQLLFFNVHRIPERILELIFGISYFLYFDFSLKTDIV